MGRTKRQYLCNVAGFVGMLAKHFLRMREEGLAILGRGIGHGAAEQQALSLSPTGQPAFQQALHEPIGRGGAITMCVVYVLASARAR